MQVNNSNKKGKMNSSSKNNDKSGKLKGLNQYN